MSGRVLLLEENHRLWLLLFLKMAKNYDFLSTTSCIACSVVCVS